MTKYSERAEVAAALEAFLTGSGGDWDFDNIIHGTFSDEVVRESVGNLSIIPAEFPSDNPSHFCSEGGLGAIRDLISKLRQEG